MKTYDRKLKCRLNCIHKVKMVRDILLPFFLVRVCSLDQKKQLEYAVNKDSCYNCICIITVY